MTLLGTPGTLMKLRDLTPWNAGNNCGNKLLKHRPLTAKAIPVEPFKSISGAPFFVPFPAQRQQDTPCPGLIGLSPEVHTFPDAVTEYFGDGR